MINKKIFLTFTIILLIFTLGILSAADTNSTDNKKPLIQKEVNNHSNKIQKVNKEEEKK